LLSEINLFPTDVDVIGRFLLAHDKVGLKRSILSAIFQLGLHGTVHRRKNQGQICCEVIVSGKRGKVNRFRKTLPQEGMQYTEEEGRPSIENVQLLQTGIPLDVVCFLISVV
jgi:acylphosphatase